MSGIGKPPAEPWYASVEEDLADLFADVRPAGLTDLADGQAGGFGRRNEAVELGRFAAAIGPIEDQKFAAQTVGKGRIKRGVGHGGEDSGKGGEFVTKYWCRGTQQLGDYSRSALSCTVLNGTWANAPNRSCLVSLAFDSDGLVTPQSRRAIAWGSLSTAGCA